MVSLPTLALGAFVCIAGLLSHYGVELVDNERAYGLTTVLVAFAFMALLAEAVIESSESRENGGDEE